MDHADINNAHSVVLVTGANSLLGTNIVECLLGAGYQVRGLLRDAGGFHLAPHPGLVLIEGSFTDTETVWNAVRGCDYVIHVAACTSQDITDYEYYRQVNVEATHRLFMYAVKAGVKRFVYVSSANCFGFGTKEEPGDEARPACRPFTDSYYARSKQEAQELLLRLSHLSEVVVVNPTFMLGAYDSKPSSGEIILRGYGKKVVFCPPGGKNFIHAGDAASGVVNALTRGTGGSVYLLSGENLSFREFYGKLSEVTGNKPLHVTIPRPLLHAAGYLGNFLKSLGVRNRFTLTNMKMLCVGNYYSNAKAAAVLGLRTRPVETAITDAVEWFARQKMI